MRWSKLFLLVVVAAACGRTKLVNGPPGKDVHQYVDPTLAQPPDDNAPPGCTLQSVEDHTLPPMPRRPLDVLFVIDDSCSMGDDQTRLSDNFDAFFGPFTARQVDFHIGVVTTDMDATDRKGQLVKVPGSSPEATFLSNATPDLSAAFTSLVNVGSNGSSIEQGLGAASAALHDPLLTGANAGFVRSDADLALVFFGDEDDQSEVVIDDLVRDVHTLKDPNTITAVSILGLDSSFFCFPGLVSGWRLAQFAKKFGDRGETVICRSDYADLMRTIAGRIVNSQCVVGLMRELSGHHAVHVTLDGQPATYVENKPDDTFPHGSIEIVPCPETGGKVEIFYDDCP